LYLTLRQYGQKGADEVSRIFFKEESAKFLASMPQLEATEI
jgi:hypothetical protein